MAYACPINAWSVNNPFPKKINIEDSVYREVNVVFTTTPTEKSIKTRLAEELETLLIDCGSDGWAYDRKTPAKKISYLSARQAKDFINYIDEVEKPMVVPYFDGSVGFEWNVENKKIISVVFKEGKHFIFSLITDDVNEYGENTQNIKTQKDLIERITGLLNNV